MCPLIEEPLSSSKCLYSNNLSILTKSIELQVSSQLKKSEIFAGNFSLVKLIMKREARFQLLPLNFDEILKLEFYLSLLKSLRETLCSGKIARC